MYSKKELEITQVIVGLNFLLDKSVNLKDFHSQFMDFEYDKLVKLFGKRNRNKIKRELINEVI